ncbi:MFS transporter [Staphylococcus simulans]|uniref:MFS transporter n=1 Tax=Staphylococcus simulans TaxID=1286 RepID=UPI003F7D24BC
MTKAFSKLLISQAFANLADVLFKVALIANVYTLTHSAIATSMLPILIGVCYFVAGFNVPLITKQVTLDKVLFYCQCAKTILLCLFIVTLYYFGDMPLPMLFSFVAVISLADGLMAPVSNAMIPFYAKDLGKANAALSMSGETIQIIGWGIGGLLYVIIGLNNCLMIVFILFIISSCLMVLLPSVPIQDTADQTHRKSLFIGYQLVMKKPLLRLMIQANLLEIFANSIWVSSVILVFVSEILHQTESYWGYANTSYSVGIIIGGMLVYRFANNLLKYKWQSIILSLVLVAIMTGLMIMVPKPSFFLLVSILIGFFSQFKEVTESVLLQEAVEKEHLVHVYGVISVIYTLSFSIFTFLMSYITEHWNVLIGIYAAIICLLIDVALILRNKNLISQQT